jgi:PASTA domain
VLYHRDPMNGPIRRAALVGVAALLCAALGACGVDQPRPPGLLHSPFPTTMSSPAAANLLVAVPNVRYSTVNEARIDLEGAGLRFRIVERRSTERYFPDTVLAQDPRPDQEVEPDSVVEVTVSKAPKCSASYPTVCIPPFGEYTCTDVQPNRNFTVKPPDPYRLDPDGDGVGCERKGR